MTDNRLAAATSPYLLQHKDNPVAWRAWGPQALEEARASDKPILLSVGYAACHWCHVMAHESFEDEGVAAVMNELFVNIKVDREERPDIDQIYMSALHALGEQGGWPLTMFLTSDAEPFWGGTYFPKEPRWGRPGFVDVLRAVAGAYRSDRSRIEENRQGLMAHLARLPRSAPRDTRVSGEIVGAAATRLAGLLDPVHGGLRGAPKFPQAPVTDLLWRASRRGSVSAQTLDHLLLTLETMSQGGIYDHIGGGLSRYSVDERWLVPHFEKMLYDNAQYLRALRLAIPLAPAREAELFRERLEETIAFLQREMELEGGGFAASLDADSEGEEGRYYVWTPDEVVSVIGPDAAIHFNQVYDITTGGNFEGRNIPNRLSAVDHIEDAVEEETLREWRDDLLEARSQRIAPGRDDKMLADWNGYLVTALAEAALLVSRESWRDVAHRTWAAIEQRMDGEDGLAHAWRDGRATRPAFASDHASLMRAALALGETAPSDEEAERWLGAARDHANRLEQDFAHPDGGYHLSSRHARDVIVRPYTPLDEAVPNSNGVAAEALIRLWLLTGDPDFRDRAERVFTAFAGEIAANVFGTASLLSAIDTRDNAVLALVVTRSGARDPAFDQALYAQGDPAIVTWTLAAGANLPATDPRAGKDMIEGQPTLYLCREGICSAPLTDPADIATALAALREAA
uniref:thioredoxin domain-containing protein n=1 Tax=Stappia sp. TaxID=1870903 RepID=UPI003BAC7570